MVWSCMQLKGTMIVPLILVETVEEQNNKGELTCEKKLTAAAEWAEEVAYHSHRGRNLEYLSCSLLAVAADLLILGPIFNQISSFVLFLLCVGVCTCCAEYYYVFIPPSQFRFDSADICTNTHVQDCGRVTKKILYFCPCCPWGGSKMKYICLYVFVGSIHSPRSTQHCFKKSAHSKIKWTYFSCGMKCCLFIRIVLVWVAQFWRYRLSALYYI